MTAARTRRHPANKTVTVGALVQQGARRFTAAKLVFGHGTTNAFDEAAYLVLYAMRLPLDNLGSVYDRRVTASERERVLALFRARIRERRPAAYLTGEAWLGAHRFRIDERALIPRSFIAELLRDDLAPWISDGTRIRTALDLCTGSGCLAILMALSFPKACIDAADLSTAAIDLAHENVATYRLGRRIRLVESDLYSALRGRRYDLIVTNPPYVTGRTMRALPAEYRHEPALALAGGRDGFDLIRLILSGAAAHLNPAGLLVVETGHARKRVERAFAHLEFTWPVTSGGDDCVFLLTREQLVAAPPAQFPASSSRGAPRRGKARGPGRASAAAAKK